MTPDNANPHSLIEVVAPAAVAAGAPPLTFCAPPAFSAPPATFSPLTPAVRAVSAVSAVAPAHAAGLVDPVGSAGTGAGTGAGLVAGDRCPATVYLARLAPTGRRVQATALNQIAALVTDAAADAFSMPWHRLRYAHTSAIRSHLAASYAPATANRMLSALRGVLREAWRLGLVTSEDFHRAVDLAPVRGERLPAGRAVTPGELAALFAACDTSPAGIRDAALLAVLYGTGVRRAEAVDLDLDDINLDTAAVHVRCGKGGKARITYLPAGAIAAVAAWIEIRGTEPGPLFCPVRRGGHLHTGHRLTGQAVRARVLHRAIQAAVEPFGPHSLRRSYVGDLLDRGADLSIVAKMCGHSSPVTTARYDRRPEAAKARAAALLHVPYTTPATTTATVTASGAGTADRNDRGADAAA